MKKISWLLKMAPVVSGVVLLAGCGGVALHNDYADYAEVYGHSTDSQLLMDMARLSQDEPPYFIQLGQINAQHTLTGTAGFSSSAAAVGKLTGLLGLGGTAGATATEQPTFQFVPLNGATFSQAITTPINPKIFYTLYDQGFPVDELARVMIQSIRIYEVKPQETDGTCQEVWVNDPTDPSYPRFLAWCYQMRTYQMEQRIIVESGRPANAIKTGNPSVSDIVTAYQSNFTLEPDSSDDAAHQTPADDKKDKDKNGQDGAPAAPNVAGTINVTGTISLAGSDANTGKGGNGQAGKSGGTTSMYVYWPDPYFSLRDQPAGKNLNPGRADLVNYFKSIINQQPPGLQDNSSTSETNVPLVITPTNSSNNQAAGAPAKSSSPSYFSTITMRTFISAMQGMAKEEQLVNKSYSLGDITLSVDPIMHITTPSVPDGYTFRKAVGLNYEGTDYFVGDIVDATGKLACQNVDLHSSNRRVFSLLSYLFSDIAIDPKQLPVQQLIQVQ